MALYLRLHWITLLKIIYKNQGEISPFLILINKKIIYDTIFYEDGRLQCTQEQKIGAIDEKQAFGLFADSLRELRNDCKLSLIDLSKALEIPNQTLSGYENKTHIPSMLQAVKISAYFHLTVEEMIVCGLDEYPYDCIELFEKRKDC